MSIADSGIAIGTAFSEMDTFWYTLQDYTSSPSFGVVDANFNPLFDLAC